MLRATVRFLMRSRPVKSHDPFILYNKSIELISDGKTGQAIESLRQLLQQDLSARKDLQADACYNLGNMYFQQREYPQAMEQWEKSIALKPSADAYANLANLHVLQRSDLDKALANYDKALELAPEDIEIRFNRAVVLDRTGNLDQAITEYQALSEKLDESKRNMVQMMLKNAIIRKFALDSKQTETGAS